jgi:hypothetical protein
LATWFASDSVDASVALHKLSGFSAAFADLFLKKNSWRFRFYYLHIWLPAWITGTAEGT